MAGNTTVSVVRVGDTVRRPVGPWTASVEAVLEHLWVVGFSGAPRPLGRDDQGRQVLEFIRGEVGVESGTYPVAELVSELAVLLGRRASAMGDFLRDGAEQNREPWARIWAEDGPYWRATADHLHAHAEAWKAALQ